MSSAAASSAASAVGGDIQKDMTPAKAYASQLKLVKEAAKAIAKAHKKMEAAARNGERLQGLDGVTEFSKTDLNGFEAQLLKELSALNVAHKAVVKGKKRSGSGASHLSKPYFVSAQIPSFFSQTLGSYGGTDAYDQVEAIWKATTPGQQESNCLAFLQGGQAGQPTVAAGVQNFTQGVFLEASEEVDRNSREMGRPYDFFNDGLASGQLLMQLFRLYFISRGKQSRDNSTYYNYDDVFVAAFGGQTNTHLLLPQGEQPPLDLTAQYAGRFADRPVDSLTETERKLALKLDVATADKSAMTRLQEKTTASQGKKGSSFIPYTESVVGNAWGISMPGIARFINFFRIPSELLDADRSAYLAGGHDWKQMEQVQDPVTGLVTEVPVDLDTRTYARRKMDATLLYIAGMKSKDKKTVLKPGLLDAYKFAVHESTKASANIKRKTAADTTKRRNAAKASASVQQKPSALAALLPGGMPVLQQQ